MTRSADVATISGSDFSGVFNQNQGTLIVECSTFSDTGLSAVAISDGTSNNRIQILPWSSRQGQVVTGGVDQCLFDNGSLTAGQIVKIGLAYAGNDCALSMNGAVPATDGSVSLPTVDRMNIGANGAGTGSFLNGHIRSIRYYPERLSNEMLQELSA